MNVQNLANLQHGDVLEKLKMQVRDIKVNLMDPSTYPLASTFGGTMQGSLMGGQTGHHSLTGAQTQNPTNNYPFTLPNPPQINSKESRDPGSNSSTSSETSNSSQQNNGWSFEEQFKQVRQLYEINDDPKRKEFLDDLFLFMQKRGSPINRLPIMAKSVLDLYELYNLVIARGGLVEVINKKLWQEIIKGLHLPSSITSAAFTLRTQYMKYLYPYECEKKNLSSPAELQAAIDGNRREGRRTNYDQYDSPSIQRSPVPQGMSQMSPLSLVAHVNQQHHRMMGGPNIGQMPNLLPSEFEQRMLDYIKLFQPKEEKRAQSPESITQREALNALEMSRVALWNMYSNNISPPNSLNTSPPEMQREALNLAESPPPHHAVKREREEIDYPDRDIIDRNHHIVPAKRSHSMHHDDEDSLSPQKLHITTHDDDDFDDRPETPPNNRKNGQNHHNESHDADDDEEEDDDHTANHRFQQQQQQQQHRNNVQQQQMPKENDNNRKQSKEAVSTNKGNTGTMGITGMQFKIVGHGDTSKTGDQQLAITMEVNGISFEGVLFAKTGPTSRQAASTPIKNIMSKIMDNQSEKY